MNIVLTFLLHLTVKQVHAVCAKLMIILAVWIQHLLSVYLPQFLHAARALEMAIVLQIFFQLRYA